MSGHDKAQSETTEDIDSILERLVSSVVGLKLANAEDYREFVPIAKAKLEAHQKRMLIGARIDEKQSTAAILRHGFFDKTVFLEVLEKEIAELKESLEG